MQNRQGAASAETIDGIAAAFTTARLGANSLTSYPGPEPSSLDEAYAIQDAAIDLWADEIAGWKVGRIMPPRSELLGCDRLAGPIFKQTIHGAQNDIAMPAFSGGFAAVEAECIFIVGKDAPDDKLAWSRDEAREMVSSIAAGVEIASSPFAGINDLGPLVTISDFGNNYGLIIGEEIPNWRDFSDDDWVFETLIDGKVVGAANAGGIPGGPLESFRFLLENAAKRGRPLKKGMAISTGAVTGVHEISIGQSASVRFPGLADLNCRMSAATPSKKAIGRVPA